MLLSFVTRKILRLQAVSMLIQLYGKNDFAEGFKILLNADLKIILLNPKQFCWSLKNNEQRILIFQQLI